MTTTQPISALIGIPRELAAGDCDGAPPELFFPESFDPVDVRYSYDSAKRICRGCPIKDACLEGALKRGEMWGVWGGMTPEERRRLKRQRRYWAA